jgi:hypothetical protein
MPFQKGNKLGRPQGRPLGSRHRLDNEFVAALCNDFHGPAGIKAIARVREEDPSTYLRVIASVLPKEHRDVTPRTLTEAELNDRIAELQRRLGLVLVDRVRGSIGAEVSLPGPEKSH